MMMLSELAAKRRKQAKDGYLQNSTSPRGAVLATEIILKYGRTEQGHILRTPKWFRQQVRLTADNRLRHVLTTGASQVSKSLVNYLCAIYDIINGINIGWVYASFKSLCNQQPAQFQAMVKYWAQPLDIRRESIFRFQVGRATANFTSANSMSEAKSGGAAEGKEQNSFQASKLYHDEKSSWKGNVDMTPRLGASQIKAKPVRENGTPGAGAGIEKLINRAEHNFEPGVICPHCGELSWLHPLGNLLKSKVLDNDPKNKPVYFSTRGEILDWWGTKENPFVACTHCHQDITSEIANCELYSKQSKQSVDEFLDELDTDVYYPSVSIYLSPLLTVPNDPYRLRDLIQDGINPESPLIYHQNKLGIESRFSSNRITSGMYTQVEESAQYDHGKSLRIVGIDQGTDTHYLVEITIDYKDISKKVIKRKTITNVVTINENDILTYLKRRKIDFALIDNEPGRKSASDLSKASGGVLALADQRSTLTDIQKLKVSYGGLEIDCYGINSSVFCEEIFASFEDCNYRINCNPHDKFETHLTSITREIESGKFIRPPNHQDDFFFALMFAEAAKTVMIKHRKPAVSVGVGNKLETYRYG